MSGKKSTSRLGLAGPLAVVAMIVMAVGASAAFGFSEFKPGTGGKFPIAFHGLGGLATFTSAEGTTITCHHSLTSGEVLSSTLADLKAKYTSDCLIENTPLGVEEGAECGGSKIETNALDVKPITITGHLSSNRGLLIQPATSGGAIAKFSCGGIAVEVKGGVICEDVPNTGKPSTSGLVTCAQNGTKNGEQLYTSGEVLGTNVSKVSLTAEAKDIFTFTEKDSQATEETVTYAEPIEQT
jgi:hypothetical protein